MKTKFHITTRTIVVIDDDGCDYEHLKAKAIFEAQRISELIGNSLTLSVEVQKGYLIETIEKS